MTSDCWIDGMPSHDPLSLMPCRDEVMTEYAPHSEIMPLSTVGRTRNLLNNLPAQERRVIMLLRAMLATGGDSGSGNSEQKFGASLSASLQQAFGQLAVEIRANRLTVFSPDSTFVSEDELAILSRLIVLQRPSQSGHWQMANPFQRALKYCAGELEKNGQRLISRPALSQAYAQRGGCFEIYVAGGRPARSTVASPPAPTTLWAASPTALPENLVAKALNVVGGRGSVATGDFLKAGISRQYLLLLCRWEYLESTGSGRYRATGSGRAIN